MTKPVDRLIEQLGHVKRREIADNDRTVIDRAIAWLEQSVVNNQLLLSYIPVARRSRAVSDVLAERGRQIVEEGWTEAHDDAHTKGEMAGAAACYALHSSTIGNIELAALRDRAVNELWPWARHWWKPKGRRSDLVRAASLLIAEIERIDRAEERKAEEPK